MIRQIAERLVVPLAIAATLTIAASACAWLLVPRVAPMWVVQHSPWLDPMMRAAIASASASGDGLAFIAFCQRMGRESDRFAAALVRTLHSDNQEMREMAVAAFCYGVTGHVEAIESIRAQVPDVGEAALDAISCQVGGDRLSVVMRSIAEDSALPELVRQQAAKRAARPLPGPHPPYSFLPSID